MRILGGTARGRRIAGPGRKDVRPTSGRVKEALFNILSDRIAQARFLDLYAGTGLIGIEALSRGASQVTFVELNPATCRVLKTNVKRCGYEDNTDVRAMSAARFLKGKPRQRYDIVFLDPPYHTGEGESVLSSLGGVDIIIENGIVVIEHFHKDRLQDRIGQLVLAKSYRYGDTLLSLYQPAPIQAQG